MHTEALAQTHAGPVHAAFCLTLWLHMSFVPVDLEGFLFLHVFYDNTEKPWTICIKFIEVWKQSVKF